MPFLSFVVQDSGLSVGRVLRSLPHDGPAIVVYALIVAFLYFVWRGNRKRPGKNP